MIFTIGKKVIDYQDKFVILAEGCFGDGDYPFRFEEVYDLGPSQDCINTYTMLYLLSDMGLGMIETQDDMKHTLKLHNIDYDYIDTEQIYNWDFTQFPYVEKLSIFYYHPSGDKYEVEVKQCLAEEK